MLSNLRCLKTRPFFISLALMSVFILSACEQTDAINKSVRESEITAENAISSISPENAVRSLYVDNRPWFGSQAVQIQGDQSLPDNMTREDALTMTFAGPVSFMEAARKIESVTGIPVAISNNIYEETMGELASREFIPSGGQEVSGGRVVWSGSLHNILNQMANIFGAEWSYNNGRVTFTTELTKTFMLNALASDLTVTGNANSSGSGGDNALPSITVDGSTTIEIWDEIEEAVDSIIGDQGQAALSPSTGTITVTARPDVMQRVENFLRYQNEMRLRRIAVSVKVLSVETSDTSEYGLDINGIIKNAIGDYSIRSAGNASGLDVSILQDNAAPSNLTAKLSASDQINRVNIVHSGSLVTISDQPAPLQVGRQIAFLERVSASGDGDSASVSLEPGTINVGLFMTVLPRIVDNDRIMMQLSIAITNADPNFRTFGTDEIQIELPELDTTGFLQNAVLGNGETLVLAGFEKRQNDLGSQTNPIGFVLGGTHNTSRSRELLVLVINSRILPHQPLTVISQ